MRTLAREEKNSVREFSKGWEGTDEGATRDGGERREEKGYEKGNLTFIGLLFRI